MLEEEDITPLFLFDDEPVRSHHEDALQLKGFSKTIAAAAVGSPGPFTIGVFAGWGQGKTSILRQARALIDRAPNQQHAVTAWVNAWRFEQEEHPIVPIILSILDGIYKKLEGTNPANPQERFLANAHRALRAIIYGFGFKGTVSVPEVAKLEASANFKEMIDRYEKLAPTPDPLVEKSLYYHAYEILDGVLDEKEFKEPPFPKIVVFIDDLDRCLPDKALKVFESIKLVLSQRGFVFVLAVDRDVIDAFLTKRYRDDFGLGEEHHHGEQYMDKIIQLPLHVPHHEGRFEEYVMNLIAHENSTSPSLLGKLLKPEEREVFASLANPLAAGTGRNPRSLIRILNRLLTDKFLWDQLPDASRLDSKIENADELLRFAAISRILENSIGISHYRQLVRNDVLCQGLLRFLYKSGIEKPFPSAKDDSITPGRDPFPGERRIIEKIETSPSLREMLLSESGKLWLQYIDKRNAMEGFLDKTRSDGASSDAETYLWEAFEAEEDGRFDEAENFYKIALAADNRNSAILCGYGIFLSDVRQDYEAAEVNFKRAIEYNSKNANYLGNYAAFLKNVRQDYDAADALFNRALKVDHKNANVLGDYGQLLIVKEQVKEGIERLRAAWTYLNDFDNANRAEFGYSLWLGTSLMGSEERVWERAFKHLIQNGFPRHVWSFDAMLAVAEKMMNSVDYDYAKALAEAFLDETRVPALDNFPRWTALEPLDPSLLKSDGTIIEKAAE